MQRIRPSNELPSFEKTRSPNLGDLLTARPSGLTEAESWAILCQSVQALQDLFLSDYASGSSCIPLVTPNTLVLSAKGRVKLCNGFCGSIPPTHLARYLAPEYRPKKQCSDTDMEKMWIYALGETIKRATLTSHAATSHLSSELCHVLTDMTRLQASSRASLMHLLDVISSYCKKRQQSRPFSHIVMDLHQEAMAAIEVTLDTPWGPPAMPELQPRTMNRCESHIGNISTIPRRWKDLTRTSQVDVNKPKLTKEASTSMEDLSHSIPMNTPGTIVRPKSMCVPDMRYFLHERNVDKPALNRYCDFNFISINCLDRNEADGYSQAKLTENQKRVSRTVSGVTRNNGSKRLKVRRNPILRAASRLYRAGTNASYGQFAPVMSKRDCVGPEFVVRASLPNKQLKLPDNKGNIRKTVLVIMLNGQKVDVVCNPNTTTAGQLFEMIIQKEHIEENFMLGLSALVAGDFVFLPSDTRICKAIQGNTHTSLTLFMRIRFFLPTLRGIRGLPARHLLYLQLRRSILEHQLPCSFTQLIELGGLALQAEFGDFNEREHGTRDYFLLEHYVPETMSCAIDDQKNLRQELIRAHRFKKGMDPEKAEQDLIILAQTLPHYGGHFYTATWMLKDNNRKDIWLYISSQGINLYQRGGETGCGPQLYEMFEWRTIQTLCYSKHYLCILPHCAKAHNSQLKKYKLKMDHKKSYFTFRLASLHHQFFLRLRTEYASLQTLSQQFGIPLKDMKNETNSLCKLEALTNTEFLNTGTVNAETEFKIDFRASSQCSSTQNQYKLKRSKSINEFSNYKDENIYEMCQNKEMGQPVVKNSSGLVLDSSCFSGLPTLSPDKSRRGVKMGIRAISNTGPRISRSMEAVNASNDYLEELSLQSVSLNCSSTSISQEPTPSTEAYILEASERSYTNPFLPNLQETLSDSLIEKLNTISFAEERIMSTVVIERDTNNSLGMQITEGSDGNVYIQAVILGGPAHLTGNVLRGDQVVAVNQHSLLGMKYNDALNVLKATGSRVEFILSRNASGNNIQSKSTLKLSGNSYLKGRINLSNINESHLKSLRIENTMNKLKSFDFITNNLGQCSPPFKTNHFPMIVEDDSTLEKHLTESCHDHFNVGKYGNTKNSDVPYHKHIRYEIEPSNNKKQLLNKNNRSKSCSQINGSIQNIPCEKAPAVVVEMIPKPDFSKFHSLDRRLPKEYMQQNSDSENEKYFSPIAVPRSLGIGRKWRGPVKYPVTPIKKCLNQGEGEVLATSDDEQVFI